MILRGCRWTGDMLGIFPRTLMGNWLGGAVILGGHVIGISNPESGRYIFPVSCC